jgi:hypothetical protein
MFYDLRLLKTIIEATSLHRDTHKDDSRHRDKQHTGKGNNDSL